MNIFIGANVYRVEITQYHDPKNMAVMLFDEFGRPECKLSTNPVYDLPENTILIRDDEGYSHKYRDALINEGVLVEVGEIHQMGWTTASLYRVHKK